MRRYWPLLYLLPGLLVMTLPLGACKDCEKLQAGVVAACATGNVELCEAAKKAFADACTVVPAPTPTLAPTPTPEPVPTPTPTPPTTPVPTPTPTPPTAGLACPKPLADGATVYLNAKRYGNGVDSTVRVRGDVAFCQAIHGVPVNDCHLEGWAERTECELELAGGCPVWQYTMDQGASVRLCRQAPHPEMSCDHWGDPVDRDDPQTPAFEGRPVACGLQRDAAGDPKAGFFIIAHGVGQVRACLPDGTGCSPWLYGKDGTQ